LPYGEISPAIIEINIVLLAFYIIAVAGNKIKITITIHIARSHTRCGNWAYRE